jgi:hypothetical protein
MLIEKAEFECRSVVEQGLSVLWNTISAVLHSTTSFAFVLYMTERLFFCCDTRAARCSGSTMKPLNNLVGAATRCVKRSHQRL